MSTPGFQDRKKIQNSVLGHNKISMERVDIVFYTKTFMSMVPGYQSRDKETLIRLRQSYNYTNVIPS